MRKIERRKIKKMKIERWKIQIRNKESRKVTIMKIE